jgi:septal ring factor EnvC (AmiA/AmiB activator)
MELGARELVQFFSLAATLAGAFAVVRSQLGRVIKDLEKVSKELEQINKRLDVSESGLAVFKHQINTVGNILSPSALKNQHTFLADMNARLRMLEGRIEKMG